MKVKHVLSMFFVTTLLIGTSCNKNADKANALVDKANEQTKTLVANLENTLVKEKQLDSLLPVEKDSPGMPSVKALSQGLVKDYETLSASCKAVVNDFDSASKYDVPEMFKKYWGLKSQAFQKRYELLVISRDKYKAMLDAIEKSDFEGLAEKIKQANEKIERLDKEASKINTQAEAIREAHPKEFK